jgi:predicted component of type VI protein secretion system
MAAVLDVHIAGPALDTTRRLAPGEPPLAVGRDADCGVCLPDPDRNVSRRHLEVWNEGGDLHFLVVSSVNGVDMPFGEAPPGARGVLAAGEVLKVGAYAVTARVAAGAAVAAAAPPTADPDPWSELDAQSARADEPTIAGTADADPFGDWGFETAFGLQLPATVPAPVAQAENAPRAGVAAFLRGAGLDPNDVGALSDGEFEAMGRMARAMALGWLQLHRETLRASAAHRYEDRTLVAPRERNPLADDTLTQTQALHYLFGGRAASAGSIDPERAIDALVAGLSQHQQAAAAAARAAVEGTLREFDPEVLKDRLLEGGARLFESSRAWEAFARDYAGQDLEAWATRLMDKHFTEAYVRALHAVAPQRVREPGHGRP